MARPKRRGSGGRIHGVLLLDEPLGAEMARGTGRPPEATVRDAMLDLVRAGTSPRQAAFSVGITNSTWHRWMTEAGVDPTRGWYATDERAPAFLREFWESIQRARSQWVARLSASVTAGIVRNPAEGRKILRANDPDGHWGDDPPVVAALPAPTQTMERQVIVLPADRLREFLRASLLAEQADAGEVEDDDPDASLASFAEIVISPTARRRS
jgi:hypothetical protein